MDKRVSVAGRTRSKGFTVLSGLEMGRKRRRRVNDDDDDVICLGDNASASAKPGSMEMGFEFLGESEEAPAEVFEIGDSDDGEEMVEVKKEEKAEEKVESFAAAAVDDDDDQCGSRPGNPVIFTHLSSSSKSDDGDDDETSDDDFRVDGVDDDDRAEADSECSSTEEEESDGDSSSSDDERRGYRRFVKERVSESWSSGVCRRKGKRKETVEVDDDDDDEEEEEEKWNGADCASVTSSKSDVCKKGIKKAEEEKHAAKRAESVINAELFVGMSSSKCREETKKAEENHHAAKRAESVNARETVVSLTSSCKKKKPVEQETDKEIMNMLWEEFDIALQEAETRDDDSTMTAMMKWRVKEDRANANGCGVNLKEREGVKNHHDKGVWAKVLTKEDDRNGDKDGLHDLLRMSKGSKDRGFKFFMECFWGKPVSDKDDQNDLEEKDGGDAVQVQTQSLACMQGILLTLDFLKKKPVEKSESEKELDMLWAEMDMCLRNEEIGSQVEREEENPGSHCEHDNIFDEEIGIQCRWCGRIEIEIKYITPPFVDFERSGRRVSSRGGNNAEFDEAMFNESADDSKAVCSRNEGTIWDLIPSKKEKLFPHQQEGIEFIWANLAGTIDLGKLRKVDPHSEGGCIISHAPGTGKTRLTMVFLQTYLQLFPKCLPVIIAPANILLTWEDELRKWNIGIPFHNLNNAELSGNEIGVSEFAYRELNKDDTRMQKLYSWYREKSILLISYNLFEKLAGGKLEDDDDEKKKRKIGKQKKRARPRECIETAMGKILRDFPGLLVLDEAHTPRNQRSCIWKVLSESTSKKRVLLSGTPFQNNFLELYNILSLMKPSFPNSIPQELKKFCQKKLTQERKASRHVTWEPVSNGDEKINQLKLLMNPFVHVHKGSILQKNLRGLRDCVLVLKPEILQQEILESIECSQNALNFEHKLALVSVHPSLFLNCSLSKKEESVIDRDQLKKRRLNPYEGVKTKFLKEFVNLCDALNEKVLVFSQFIDTLDLIKDQLKSAYNWSEGNEVLFMHGKLDQKQKQLLIHRFNDENSQAKVLLASIKASSEGINLVGASRVVLLDVVWNPSVERQAICRAYRLGQTRVVYTYHLLAQGTPEWTKYCKQAEKNRVSKLVFSNGNAENDKLKSSGVVSEDGVIEDKVLDSMVQHEKLMDMFGKCLVQPKDGDLEFLGS